MWSFPVLSIQHIPIQILLRIVASVASATAINLNGSKTVSANALSTFIILFQIDAVKLWHTIWQY